MPTRIRIVLFLSLLCSIVIPSQSAQAQSTDLDARCFTKSECIDARRRQKISPDQLANGFYNKKAETRTACQHKTDTNGEELGFCLAAGEVETGVKFGTTNKFAHMGDFMFYLYRYGIIFAGVLAVIMIIVAGFQWTASGGNSSTIESAKNRITGAITGLVLALTSYVILNTINPSTVNLRLPMVWLIREEKIRPQYEFCLELPPTKTTPAQAPLVGFYGEGQQSSGNYTSVKTDIPAYTLGPFSSDGTMARYEALFPPKTENSKVECGKTYVVENSEGATCKGSYCPNGNFCNYEGTCEKFEINGGGIGGSIGYIGGKYIDEIRVSVVCQTPEGTREIEDIEEINKGEGERYYEFENVAARGIEECGSEDKIIGYYLLVEVNDSDALNTTDDEWFGGKSLCANLHAGGSCGLYGSNSVSVETDIQYFGLDGMATIGELFRQDDLKDNKSFRCDFFNTPKSMPNLGDGLITNSFVGSVSKLFGKKIGNSFATPDSASVDDNFCPYLRQKEKDFEAALQAQLRNP